MTKSIDITGAHVLINGQPVDPEMACAVHPWLRKYIGHLLRKDLTDRGYSKEIMER